MAKQKLSELTQATTIGGTDLLYVVQSNTSKSVNVNLLSNVLLTNARIRAAISVTGNASYDSANGIITVTAGASGGGGGIANLIAGDNITIEPNNRISANVALASNINLTVGNIIITGNISANSFVSTGNGIPSIESDTNINLRANNAVVITNSVLRLRTFTNAQLANVIATNGDLIYNTSNNKFQGYANNVWVDLH